MFRAGILRRGVKRALHKEGEDERGKSNKEEMW